MPRWFLVLVVCLTMLVGYWCGGIIATRQADNRAAVTPDQHTVQYERNRKYQLRRMLADTTRRLSACRVERAKLEASR